MLEVLWIHWIAPSALGLDPVAALTYPRLDLHPPDIAHGFIWQLGTYMLLHDPMGPGHVLLNLVFIWIFGAGLELRWGPQRFLRFYLLCGVIAGVVVVLAGIVFPSQWDSHTVGSSGALHGLIAAFGVLYANARMWPIPIKAKHFIWGLVAVNVLFMPVQAGDSFAAHMGGLLAGYLLVTGNWRPRRWVDRLALWQLKRRKARLKVVRRTSDGGDDGPSNGRVLH